MKNPWFNTLPSWMGLYGHPTPKPSYLLGSVFGSYFPISDVQLRFTGYSYIVGYQISLVDQAMDFSP